MEADGERVVWQADAPFHLTKDGEILGSTQLAFNDQRRAKIHDELLGRAAHWYSLRGLLAATARRRDRLISSPHVTTSANSWNTLTSRPPTRRGRQTYGPCQ